jgi:hypothetical protein
MPDIQELILSELRDLRKETSEGFSELLQRTTKLETQIEPLQHLEPRVNELEHAKWKATGVLAACAVVLQPLLWTAKKHLGL